MKKAKLYVSECYADGGPVLKRVRPRAKGRCGLSVVAMCRIHTTASCVLHEMVIRMQTMVMLCAGETASSSRWCT